MSAVVHRDAVAPITWAGEETGRFLLRSEDTDGRFSYYEVIVPAGHGTLVHVHADTDEMIHVLAGEFEIVVGEEVHRCPAGTVVFGPRGVPHAFRNVGPGPGTLLCLTTPGGIERFFEQLSVLLQADSSWPELDELARRHGITAVSPHDPPEAAS
jgi:quercetin dioxygenase-like cupin family protein